MGRDAGRAERQEALEGDRALCRQRPTALPLSLCLHHGHWVPLALMDRLGVSLVVLEDLGQFR